MRGTPCPPLIELWAIVTWWSGPENWPFETYSPIAKRSSPRNRL